MSVCAYVATYARPKLTDYNSDTSTSIFVHELLCRSCFKANRFCQTSPIPSRIRFESRTLPKFCGTDVTVPSEIPFPSYGLRNVKNLSRSLGFIKTRHKCHEAPDSQDSSNRITSCLVVKKVQTPTPPLAHVFFKTQTPYTKKKYHTWPWLYLVIRLVVNPIFVIDTFDYFSEA